MNEPNDNDRQEDSLQDIEDDELAAAWDDIEEIDLSFDLGLGALFGSTEDTIENLARAETMPEEKAELIVNAGYDSMDKIKAAGVEELYAVDGVGATHAAMAFKIAREALADDESETENGSDGALAGIVDSSEAETESVDADAETHDHEPEPESPWSDALDELRDLGKRVGITLGKIPVSILGFILGVLGGISAGILGKLPKRVGIYRKMIKMGYAGMWENTSAHVVANTVYGDGEMVARPATHDKETGSLETNNGEEWTATSGMQPVRIGKTPVVTGVADQHELVNPVAARVAEAVDYSPKRYQTVDERPEGFAPVETQAAGAVADGGASMLERSTTFSDIWVDARNPDPSNDGWIISMEKAYELHWDQAASEEMENQETRGILAAKDPSGDTKRALILVLIAIGCFCLGLFGPALAQQLAPSTGGGGGGTGVQIVISSLELLL